MAKNFKLEVDEKTRELLAKTGSKSFLASVRKEFKKKGPARLKRAIYQDILRGISPVNGQGKFKKYSTSYKDAIKGRAAFYTNKQGKVIAIRADAGVSDKELRQFRASKSARKQVRGKRKSNKSFISKLNAHLSGKRISPVNMKLTGKMLRSGFTKTTGGLLRSFRLVIGFKDEKAEFHNRLGAGKSKVIRRLLPTGRSERFNKRITNTLLLEVQKALDTVANKLSGK